MRIRRSKLGHGHSRTWKAGALLLTLATTVAGALLAAGPAHADSTTNELLVSNLSWLNVSVRGGSYSTGTDIIQWTSTGGTEQRWAAFQYTGVDGSSVHRFRSVNSGLCITTDGVAGDPLTQETCSPDNGRQVWIPSYVWWAAGYSLYNPATGLNMDVSGASYGAGAEIDAWYPNNGLNQVFSTPGSPDL